ncbi:hypothetical protein VNI00_011654 [Paramarasmius palmivorus]|uniref:Uncharacterized protein n=1 Tax=Paramarasmius palmivorus TaxID=297713 RepID=A0AAW0CBU4_9AGAR
MQRLSFNVNMRTELLRGLEKTFFQRRDLKPRALRLGSVPPRHSCRPPEFDITTLTSLSLSGSVTFSPITTRQVIEFVSHFTYLEDLHLDYKKRGDLVPQALSEAESRSQLRPLKVSLLHLRRMKLRVPLDDFLPWLDSAQLPSLVYLHLFTGAPPPGDRNAAPRFLQSFIDSSCAQTVKDICIWFMWETLPALEFSRCHVLRALRLVEWGTEDAVTDFPKLTNIVRTIKSPVDVFAFEWPSTPQLDNVRWFIGQDMDDEWQKEPERSYGSFFFPLSYIHP